MIKYTIGILILLFAIFSYLTFINRPNSTILNPKNDRSQINKISKVIIEDYNSKNKYYLPGSKNDIVHLWASWCEPCVVEFPEIIKQFEDIKSHSNLYLVSLDSNEEDLERFLNLFPELKTKKIPIIFDKDKSIAKWFNVSKLPKTVVIEKETGNFIKTIEGLTNWTELGLVK
jgi:thiol-disulfide isomerase/thioredoxin